MLKVAQWKVVCYVYSPANTLEIVLLVYFCFTPFSSSQQHKDFFNSVFQQAQTFALTAVNGENFEVINLTSISLLQQGTFSEENW